MGFSSSQIHLRERENHSRCRPICNTMWKAFQYNMNFKSNPNHVISFPEQYGNPWATTGSNSTQVSKTKIRHSKKKSLSRSHPIWPVPWTHRACFSQPWGRVHAKHKETPYVKNVKKKLQCATVPPVASDRDIKTSIERPWSTLIAILVVSTRTGSKTSPSRHSSYHDILFVNGGGFPKIGIPQPRKKTTVKI